MHIPAWLIYTSIFGGGFAIGGFTFSNLGKNLLIIGIVGAGIYAYTKAK